MDLSDRCVEALRHAILLSRAASASLTVLHVVRLGIGGEELGIPRARLVQELVSEARAWLRRTVHAVGGGVVPVRIVIVEGRPCEVILSQARALGVDLIIMGCRRNPGWIGRFCQRTSRRVSRNAHCPVVAVACSSRRSVSV
jgi:nucleotide-binding universal stress UspA family protein